ncbi:MAG: AAA family ATPase [Actinomycetota bacterium]
MTGQAEPGGTLVARRDAEDWERFASSFARIADNVMQVIQGKAREVRLALACLIAEGHLLIEDVPGVGKTMLAKSIARSIDCSFRRIQFTPDLLPTDVTGVNVYNQERGDFEFKPGAIFANIVLGDEINRASPKTQSALLESMEEHQVTVDGATYHLGIPFMVIATQNPIEHEGTYPLPEAQLDRFMMRLSLGYPSPDSEAGILTTHGVASTLEDISAVTDAQGVSEMVMMVRDVHVDQALQRYIVSLADATRRHPDVYLGASPRASIMLLRAARAFAACDGRDYVIPDDVKGLVVSVLAHRMLVAPDAAMSGRTPQVILREILDEVPIPVRDRA